MAIVEVDHAKDGQHIVQGTLDATDETLTLDRLSTAGSVGIQLTGTFTGTVTFEASVDGSTFVAVSLLPAASTTPASTATAVGIFGFQNNFAASVRARFSTASSGAVVVTIKSLPSQF